MLTEKNYLINEAAKEVHVESHVLRYWEEELGLAIGRNEQGHRIYTKQDIDKFITIKNLKDQGLQLKAVKLILEGGSVVEEKGMKTDNPFAQKQYTKINRNNEMKVIHMKPAQNSTWKGNHMIEVREKKVTPAEKQQIALKMKENTRLAEEREEKYARMQYLLQKMIHEAVEANNEKLAEKLSEHLKNDMCKELDYQFRLLEERSSSREEENRKAQEEHYRRLDELLTQYSGRAAHKKESEKVLKKENKDRKGFLFLPVLKRES